MGFIILPPSFPIGFPDNTYLLKRLHSASRYDDGKLRGCGCSRMYIEKKLEIPSLFPTNFYNEVLLEVDFTASGFFRNTGEEFYGTTNLIIRLIEPVN